MTLITVLWEDEADADVKNFGPHVLLRACVADELGMSREAFEDALVGHPMKGVTKMMKDLRRDVSNMLNAGPVFAVVDLDKVHVLWKGKPPNEQPVRCKKDFDRLWKIDAPGDYEVVFMEDNTESLIEAACAALGIAPPMSKPRPRERDSYLQKAAWSSPPIRGAIRQGCKSFDRLVKKVSAELKL